MWRLPASWACLELKLPLLRKSLGASDKYRERGMPDAWRLPHQDGPSFDRAETHVLSFESDVNLCFPTMEGVAPHYRSDCSSYKLRGLGSSGSQRATSPKTLRHIGRDRGLRRTRQAAFSRSLCCPSWRPQLFVRGDTLLPSPERS